MIGPSREIRPASLFSRLLCVCLLAQAAEAQIIRRIEIVRHPVFEADDLPLGAANLLNSLHVRTAESVIRRDLLVRPGDVYDSFLVAESARLLRQRSYLGDVDIAARNAGADSIDLQVHARDLWTLEVSVQPRGGGGAYELDVGVAESNFRGRGEGFDVGYLFSDRRKAGRLSVSDPAFFHPHLTAAVGYSAHEEGNSFSALLTHPFWAVTVPWQYALSIDRWRDNLLFYKDNRAAFAYPQVARRVHVEIARAWGVKRRLIAGTALTWEEERLGGLFPYSGVAPAALADTVFFSRPDRRRVTPSVAVRLEQLHYRAARFLDRFGRVEDFPTGWDLTLKYGRISADLGSTASRGLVAAQVRGGMTLPGFFGDLDLQLQRESASGASEGSLTLDGSARLYVKPALRHTLALRLAHTGWYQANREGQLFLGALSGTRGLSARGRDGSRLWFANAEYRYFSGLRVLTVDLGAVLFVDVGQVWDRGEALRIGDAEISYGAGLRFGLGRAAGEKVFRIDLAHGADGWVTTYGTRMYFSFDLNSPMRF